MNRVELNTLREQAVLLKAMDRAVSGMRLAEAKLAASAHNTANALTEGFSRVQVDGVTVPDGGVDMNVSTLPAEDGPDIVAEVIEQKSAVTLYRANLKVVKATDEMIGDLLNTRG